MIAEVGTFIVVVAVFYAACFFAFCLGCALVGVVGYLLFGVFLYITSPRFRRDVHTLLVEVVKMAGRATKRAIIASVQFVSATLVRIKNVVLHPLTTLRGEKKGKFIVEEPTTRRSTQDGSGWAMDLAPVTA